MEPNAEKLMEQIDRGRKEIYTDSYAMSVGELTNLYRDGDLEIYPEFQRMFRWTPAQKSRFIESLLLGIPIPSLFVHQRDDGVWDVIDGVQRLSTILEFMGLLKDDDGVVVDPTHLVETDILPALAGMYWSSEQGEPHLSPEQQRIIKRASLSISIVTRESDNQAKFDLFQRLNTGGSQLSDQETRDALLIMSDPEFGKWYKTLANNEAFKTTTSLSDASANQAYDNELVLRFLVFKDASNSELGGLGDMSDEITDRARDLIQFFPEKKVEWESDFTETFSMLSEAVGDQAFRRFTSDKNKFEGGFLVSAFEVVALGLVHNLSEWKNLTPDERSRKLDQRVRQLWTEQEFRKNAGSGIRGNTRVGRTVPFARDYFAPNED